MNEIKPWYLSRTIWASLATVGIAAAGAFGVRADGLDEASLTEILLQGAAVVAGIVAIFGRLRATSRIGRADAP